MAYPLEELELLFGEMDEKSQKTVDSFKTELRAAQIRTFWTKFSSITTAFLRL